jgi:PIN domain nuclease of toxin-antitoxin system
MTKAVMDASALLARFRREPGAQKVDELIDGSYVSAVNVAEFVQRIVDLGASEAFVEEVVENLPCRIEPFDRTAGIRAGLLRRHTRAHGLSLGDRACLELGARLGQPVVTADRAWAELDVGVEVVLIR